ncbi:hypothetical protein [Acinetobacter venetianus]|uniref:hypothetical protein n=1 Tax=Acinetobacter venetianus TaxID=52133 RepID=UPI00289BA805|nr:hypothetical protein [Acinetobacter venetianus]
MLGKVSGTSLDCSPVSGLVWANNIYPNSSGTLTFDLSAPNHNVSVSNASFEFVEILNQNMQAIFIMFLNELVTAYPFIKILGINSSPESTYHFEAAPDFNGNYLLYSQNGDFESDPITLTLKAALSNPIDDLYPHLGGESLPPQMSIHTCGLHEILA